MQDLNKYYKDVEETINYTFNNEDLLFQAFTRSSYAYENGGRDNEQLEFIGDAVLEFIVTKRLSEYFGTTEEENNEDFDEDEDENEFFFPGKNEGSLSKLRTKLVNKETLAERIDELGFKEYLYMGKGDINLHMEDDPSVKEDLFEAILGAVAIDSEFDIEELEDVVEAMLDLDSKLENETDSQDYVSLLQEWDQKFNCEIPSYTFIEKRKKFIARVTLNTERGIKTYEGEKCSNKIKARSSAARYAYEDLLEHKEIWNIENELPKDISEDNAINILQELAQKKYQDFPEYTFEEENLDENGFQIWSCRCEVPNKRLSFISRSSSKKDAKKAAAYGILKKEFNL